MYVQVGDALHKVINIGRGTFVNPIFHEGLKN